jgi:hypothetical protein
MRVLADRVKTEALAGALLPQAVLSFLAVLVPVLLEQESLPGKA